MKTRHGHTKRVTYTDKTHLRKTPSLESVISSESWRFNRVRDLQSRGTKGGQGEGASSLGWSDRNKIVLDISSYFFDPYRSLRSLGRRFFTEDQKGRLNRIAKRLRRRWVVRGPVSSVKWKGQRVSPFDGRVRHRPGRPSRSGGSRPSRTVRPTPLRRRWSGVEGFLIKSMIGRFRLSDFPDEQGITNGRVMIEVWCPRGSYSQDIRRRSFCVCTGCTPDSTSLDCGPGETRVCSDWLPVITPVARVRSDVRFPCRR